MFETIKSWFSQSKANNVVSPFAASFSQRFQGLLGGGKSRKYLDEYRNWVYACIQARGEEIGNIDFELYQDGEEIDQHDILDLLYKPNPYMSKSDFFYGIQAFLDLDGNAFVFLARDQKGKGQVREMYLLRPDRVDIVINKTNPLQVEGYVYKQQGGANVPFDAADILHFKNFNPKGDHPFPHRGMAPVEAAIWAIDTDNEARQWNYSFFKNSARPDGFLVKDTPGAVDEAEFKRLKLQFQQEHQGSANAYKIAIISGGLKWQEVTKSQKDMDFVLQRQFSRDEILSLFRVPKTAIGIVEDVNRANAEATNYIFALRTIKPLMQKIVSTLNEFLVPMFDESGSLELDFASPVPEDEVAEAAYFTQALDKWMTRNEIRELEGLPPTENGDSFFLPFNVAPGDKVIPSSPTKTNEKPKVKAKDKKKKNVDDIVEEFVAKLNPPVEVKQLPALAKANYAQIWMKLFDVETGPVKKHLDAMFEDQKKQVIKNIQETYKGLEIAEYKFKAVEDLLYNQDSAIQSTISFMTPNVRRWIKQSGQQAMLLTGVGSTFDESTPEIEKFITDRTGFFANTFDSTTASALLDSIKEGLDNNETSSQLSDRVSEFYDNQISYRSDRAARTEVSASSNFAAEQAYGQAGVKQMQWFVVAPEDEGCVANDGAIADVGGTFPSGDDAPPVHPNCVCTILPYFG